MDIRSGDHGEIEAINYILEKQDIDSGHIVEIGAWDGIKHSNIYHLIQNGWSGTLIEMDPDKFKELTINMEPYDVDCVCDKVSLEDNCTINDIIDRDFDIFSLDIDGNDYWVWKSLARKPKIVIAEYNSNWDRETSISYDPNHMWDGSQYFGASASAMRRLGNNLGYDLVGFVKYRNLFFVRKDINTLPIMDDLSNLIQYPHHREMTKKQKMQLVEFPHMNKLHLGCGPVSLPGFTNIDIRWMPGVDKIADIRYLSPRDYPSNSVDLIYASHVLEHISRWEYKSTLSRWYDMLKEGGILRLAVPDFESLTKYYMAVGNIKNIMGLLYGGQDYRENRHHWIWDYDSLKDDLKATGFRNIYKWDWRKTSHSYIDDLSQAYLPHMDKENGFLVSLNVEAVK